MYRVLIILLMLFLVSGAALAQDATQEPVAPTPNFEELYAVATRAAQSAEAAERARSDSTNLIVAFAAVLALSTLGVIGWVVTKIGESITRTKEIAATKEELNKHVANLRGELTHWQNARSALILIPFAEQQYKAGDYDGAIQIYKRALELDDNNPLLHYRLGYVYGQRDSSDKELANALKHLEKALEIDPNFVLAKAARGYVLRLTAENVVSSDEKNSLFHAAAQELTDALRTMEELVDEEGESWRGSLGGLYRRQEQWRQAIEQYEKALKITPFSSYLYNNLALLYLHEGRLDDAFRAYATVKALAQTKIATNLNDYWAYGDLLTAKLVLGQRGVEKLADRYKQTVPIDKTNAIAKLIETLELVCERLNQRGSEVVPAIRHTIDNLKAEKALREQQKSKTS